jgi:hypothetical protein
MEVLMEYAEFLRKEGHDIAGRLGLGPSCKGSQDWLLGGCGIAACASVKQSPEIGRIVSSGCLSRHCRHYFVWRLRMVEAGEHSV